ncbi:hypothetical protein [Mucilaginibacter boryungensis]|uniref:Uncharacterized protein n=1 Tax=Mucilaginibacter boryungensis TaxID=768480 RepID=A0ABR9XCE7_9SPHI|nr:hypothetical protein [Mucilaginibacter boryungensis]MBE9665067.1 hypothetical protein [Mucilaginibacter boryungensis]
MTFTEYDLFVILERDGYYIKEFDGLIYIDCDIAQMIADDYNERNGYRDKTNGGFADVYNIAELVELRGNSAVWNATCD